MKRPRNASLLNRTPGTTGGRLGPLVLGSVAGAWNRDSLSGGHSTRASLCPRQWNLVGKRSAISFQQSARVESDNGQRLSDAASTLADC